MFETHLSFSINTQIEIEFWIYFQFLQDNLFPSAVPGLGLPGNSSSKGYLGSLSNRNGDGTIGEFSIEREDFPALGKCSENISHFFSLIFIRVSE